MKEKYEQITGAIELWHIVVGAIIISVSVIGWAKTELPTKTIINTEHDKIRAEMTVVHDELKEQHRKYNTDIEEMRHEQRDLKELVEAKIRADRLDAVNRDIRNNESEQFQILQWIKVNGEDTQSAKRLSVLKSEREELSVKRNCIVSNIHACDSP